MVKILGSIVASILQGEDTDTDVLSLVDKVKDQGKDSEVKVKLFLFLRNLDNKLLSKCLEEIAGYVRLLSPAVSEISLIISPSSPPILFHSGLTSPTATCCCL